MDGVKALFFYRNGEVHTSSRGGQDYDIPTTYIRTNPEIVAFFKKHPSTILDGELYIHGTPLEKISGLCRLEKLTEEHKNLQYHCYDIVNENLIYETRLETINGFIKEYSEKPLPYINWVETYYLSKADSLEDFRKNVMEIHDIFIKEGYEGAILRDLDATYKCGGRDKRMYKVKCFIDGEYKITGLSEGLREEDMSFELVTAEGYPFKAKPEGDRALKHWYHEHIKEMIGH